ncbi:MAG: valine--tRNA ligase [Acholeplasmataceae bacterium]|nr:valine--tRNA ligase [Acholeplasmataceae bacterium]
MAIKPKYDHKEVETGLYEYWLKNKYFESGDLTKKPFCTVIPPPNVTGKLHLGHAMDNTLQDIIIRRKRMQGYDALYLPGMDHAGIATQAKVDQKLKEEGTNRFEIGREAFLEEAWRWKEEYSHHIHDQWKALGISVDYNHERFTLDKKLNDAVNYVFVELYKKGLIYRGNKIINWDVEANTAISNIEVDYIEQQGFLYYITYPFVNRKGGLTVATTRPETMFADQALMVHPNDERFKQFIGSKVYIPTTNVEIPVIADDYVDMEFGTGVVKVTPAHDANDFEVGIRHNFEMPLCMTSKGFMNEMAFKYEGMERFNCRDALVKELDEKGFLYQKENYVNNIGLSERTGVVVEPRLSLQWFIKMEPLAKQALDENTVKFIPERFQKVFTNWMEGIEDWCISRQLWWGHRIPVWYKGDDMIVQAECPGEGYIQDEDVLDTWFSSALWPFSTLGWPEKTDLFKRYYPTDVLVTGYDIIFFWVARMIFQGIEFTNESPFKEVLIHGLIRDSEGRKMSKSLNNGIDPMDVIEQYGVDSLRYFLSTNSTPGQDMRFEIEKVESSWNFINKLWNIVRFVEMRITNPKPINSVKLNIYDKDLLSRVNALIKEVDINFDRYDFGEVSRSIYNFTWDYFASNYVEYAKLNLEDESRKESTESVLYDTVKVILKLLHPFMPFVTERLYQNLTGEQSIMISEWPVASDFDDQQAVVDLEMLNEIIKKTRNFRAEHNLPKKELKIWIETENKTIQQEKILLKHFLKSESCEIVNTFNSKEETFLLTGLGYNLYILKGDVISLEEEIQAIEEELAHLENELNRSNKMLSNPQFLTKASPEKVSQEKEKQQNYERQYRVLLERLQTYESK